MNSFFRFLLIFLFFIFTFFLCLISFIRASFTNITENNNMNLSRTIPLSITYIKPDGRSVIFVYKIPSSRVKINNPLYFFKRVRDYYWLVFSKEYLAKSEMSLFLGDKKFSESIQFLKINQPKYAIISIERSFDKLQYAQYLFGKTGLPKEHELQQKIIQAGLAYEITLKSFCSNNNQINQLINEIKNWNDNQQVYKLN
jgi:hypothetical protein